MRRAALAVAVLILAGCASSGGRPTITLDAEAFVSAYMAERDGFRDRTWQARVLCALGQAKDPAACDALAAKQKLWRDRDAVVLKALLNRNPIDAEMLRAASEAGLELLGAAARVAPLLGLAI